MDRSLGLRERLQMRLHLLICSGCRNFFRQVRILRGALRRHPDLRDSGD